jgi:hypothetical protein
MPAFRVAVALTAIRLSMCALVSAACNRETAEQKTERTIENMERSFRSSGDTPEKSGNVRGPKGLADAVDKFAPIDLIREAAGYYVSLNNLPVMLASAGPKGQVLTIVAPQYEREYPIDEIEDAIKDYKRVLKNQGYSLEGKPDTVNPRGPKGK